MKRNLVAITAITLAIALFASFALVGCGEKTYDGLSKREDGTWYVVLDCPGGKTVTDMFDIPGVRLDSSSTYSGAAAFSMDQTTPIPLGYKKIDSGGWVGFTLDGKRCVYVAKDIDGKLMGSITSELSGLTGSVRTYDLSKNGFAPLEKVGINLPDAWK